MSALLRPPTRALCALSALPAALLLIASACDKSSPGPEEPAAAEDPASSASQAEAETAEPADPATPSADPGTALASAETTPADPAHTGDPTAADTTEPVATPEAVDPPADPKATKTTKTKTGLPKAIFGEGNASCGKDPGVGQPLKAFSLKTTSGKTITSGNLKGRVVLLNFWGTWCKPCLKELPEFDRLYRRYRKSGLALLAIATDSDPEPVNAIVKERRLSAKIAIGGEEYANSYKSPNFPFSFVVDKKGIIQASYRGFKPECLGQLEQDIRAQLED